MLPTSHATDTPSGHSLADECRTLLSLEQAVQELEASAKDARMKLDSQRHVVATRLMEEGVDQMRIDGRTVHLRTDLFATFRPGDMPESDLRALLRDYDLEALVKPTVNAMSFRSAVRELVKMKRDEDPTTIGQPAGELLPEPLQPYVHCYEETRAFARKG